MSTEAQIEEKRQKDLGGRHRADEETWADKFGSHRPLPFPEQSRDPGGPSQGEGDQGGALLNLESHRGGDISGGAGADDKWVTGPGLALLITFVFLHLKGLLNGDH